MRHIYLIIILCFTSSIAQAQTKRAYIKAAEKAVAEENHYAALTYYSEVLDFDEADPEVNYQVAEAARKFAAYDIAAKHYGIVVDSLVSDSFPLAVFHLADMKHRLGQYEEATNYYNLYIAEYSGTDEYYEAQAVAALEHIEWAQGRLENPDRSANMELMDGSINSPYSDFGALKVDSTIYYSTMLYEELQTTAELPRSISKLHTYESEVSALLEGSINTTDQLVAHTTFNQSGTMMYYTVCDYVTAEDIRCDIYQSVILEDGSVAMGAKLGPEINMDSVTNTQPHLAYDEAKGQEVLYFVSDRAGGKGKLDIYYSHMDSDGNFAPAENLEYLNTAENEATPYYNPAANKLYFSSDGRQGLGGYDIYYAEGILPTGTVESLRPPMNSSYHELYYTVDGIEEEAYFSSNRDGATYLDPEKKACCFDIYKVIYDEVIIDLDAITYDAFTKRPLLEATVHLVDVATGDTVSTVYAQSDSSHVFKLRRDTEYLLIAEREHYNTVEVSFNTNDISKSEQLIERIYMTTDKMQLDVFTFNDRTKEELEGVTLRIIDITDPDNPIYLETNDVGNDFHAYLELGKKYKLEAAKFGFVTETVEVDLRDVTEPGLITEKMYLEVFDIEDYMPVSIYFDNDQPDPRAKTTVSSAVYGNLYDNYVREKQRFIKKVARRMTPDVKAEAERDIAAFFEGDVAGGYERLKRFMRALKKELELGRSLEIAVKGYTSPLAETKYNLALGQRRVASVKNEMLAYQGGLFKTYLENGQLIITDISFGEELANKAVSDNKNDQIGSIYSVGASRERKVEIVSIKDQ